MQLNNKSIEAGIWYTIFNFIICGIGFFTTPIFSRVLSHLEYGLYSDYIACLGIFAICFTMYFESTFIRAKYDYSKEFDDYIFSTLILSTIIVLFFACIFNILHKYVLLFLGLNRFELNTIFFHILFLPAINMFLVRERLSWNYKISILVSFMVSAGTLCISLICIIFFQNKFHARIVGDLIMTIAVGGILYFRIYKKSKTIKISYWKYALRICIPFVPHLLSIRILSDSDRIMITKLCNPEDNAIYSIAYSCASISIVLTGAMNDAFAPWLGEKLNNNMFADIRKASNIYILIYACAVFAFILMSPELLLLYAGNSYILAKYLIPPIAGGFVFQFLYTLYVNVEQYCKKTFGMAIASVIAAFINILLNYLFIPKYGYKAASYTTFISYLFLLLFHMFLVRFYGYKSLYSNGIYALIIFTIIFVFISNYMYEYIVIRYIILAVFLFIATVYLLRNKSIFIKKM